MSPAKKVLVCLGVLLLTFSLFALRNLGKAPPVSAQSGCCTGGSAICQTTSYDNCDPVACQWVCAAPTAVPGGSTPIPGGPTPTVGVSIYNGTWYAPTLKEFRERVFNPPSSEIFGERYTYAQVNWIIHSLTLQAPDVSNSSNNEQIKNAIGELLFEDKTLVDAARLGPFTAIAYSAAEMYGKPPASGIQEIASTLQKFNPASTAYAQGYGYTNTSGIRPIWIASRNTAYFFIIILLVIAGFMIMFRVKINPQTVVSVQLIIPRLIIALLGITFSYAIAGLIIDFVYVIVIFVLSAISAASGTEIISNLGDSIQFFATPGFFKVLFFFLIWWLAYTIGQITALSVLTAIFSLLLIIVVLFVLVRVWWMMFKAYITLMLTIVIGPWQIMLGVLPGNSNGFGKWIKNIISSASVFVIVPLMLMLAIVMFGQPPTQGLNIFPGLFDWIMGLFKTGVNFQNTGGGYPEFPLFGFSNNALDFKFFGAVVILSIIPKTAQMIQEALKTDNKLIGSAVGEAMGSVPNAYNRFVGSQRAADERAIRDAQLKDRTGAEPRFMSGGIGGEYEKLKMRSNEKQTPETKTQTGETVK